MKDAVARTIGIVLYREALCWSCNGWRSFDRFCFFKTERPADTNF